MKTRLSNDVVGMLHEQAKRRANPFSGGSNAVFGQAAQILARRGEEWAESVLWYGKLAPSSRADSELLVLADRAEARGKAGSSKKAERQGISECTR